MKKLILVVLVSSLFISWKKLATNYSENVKVSYNSDAKSVLDGAWKATEIDSTEGEITIVSIVSGGFISTASYSVDSLSFISTSGGELTVDGSLATKKFEFNTSDPTLVGTSTSTSFELKSDTLLFKGDDKVWLRIDNGTPGALAGAWLITGRKRNGELSRRAPGARRTMKILSGTRFQWIAFNDATAQFMGSGGGTYTTAKGQYTEHIEFFSRDSSRVGASLQFDFKISDEEWHHSGKSSKGDPMYEIWSSPEKAFESGRGSR